MARAVAAKSQERTGRLMMIGAVVFAALAAVLVFVALQQRDSGGSSAATQDVVVATQDISVNTKITADMLRVKALPSDDVVTGAYAATESIIGLPARYPIQAGEQITSNKLGVKAIDEEKDIALILPDGKRAFAIEASETTAVGGLLLPGNNIDVIAVFGDKQRGDAPRRAVTVLQNISVLAVAQEAQEPVPAASSDASSTPAGQGLQGERPTDVQRQPDARSVTLAVTPEQAQLLAALQIEDEVDLWLALRPAGDTAELPVGETNLQPFYP